MYDIGTFTFLSTHLQIPDLYADEIPRSPRKRKYPDELVDTNFNEDVE